MASSEQQQHDDSKKRRKRLPCKGSFKSQPQFLKEGGQPMPGILDFPPNVTIARGGSLMHGTFCPETKLVQLSNIAGKMVSHMGFVKPGCQGAQFLHPEEALFLLEAGKLLVHYNEGSKQEEQTGPCISSVQEAYCLLLSSTVPLSRYIVYARLARTGFKVLISTTKTGDRIYDAHTPTIDFAKTHPPPPAFRVVAIYRWDEPFPPIAKLVALRNENSQDLPTDSNVALKIAIIAPDGDVSFYSVNCPMKIL